MVMYGMFFHTLYFQKNIAPEFHTFMPYLSVLLSFCKSKCVLGYISRCRVAMLVERLSTALSPFEI